VVWLGLLLAALSLAGAPFTSGAFAKAWVKAAAGMLPQPAWGVLSVVLPLAAVGTTLLLGRFLYVLRNRSHRPAHPAGAALWVPWALLLAPTVWIPAGAQVLEPGPVAAVGTLVAAVWPVAAGAAFAALAAAAARAGKRMPRLPAGDLVEIYGRAWRTLVGTWNRCRGAGWRSAGGREMFEHLRLKAFAASDALDARLTVGRLQGVLLMLLIGVLYLSGVLAAAF
jgi:hypothetical protein